MLREVWRLQRDQFWSADLSGVDWDAVWKLYRPLVDRVATRADFSDLVWEMQGELGTSHAYESGGDHRKPPCGRARTPRVRIALGRCARRLGDHRDRARRRVGSARRLSAQRDRRRGAGRRGDRRGRRPAVDGDVAARGAARPPRRAEGAARARRRAADRRREVVVTALADDVPVYYRQWVEKNRAWVHERSGGRVGYLHVPDMQAGRLRRVPPLLRQRVRARRADRRRPLQPRRPRLAAAAREGRAPAHRLRPLALDERRAPIPRRPSPARSSRSPTSTPARTATSSRTTSS